MTLTTHDCVEKGTAGRPIRRATGGTQSSYESYTTHVKGSAADARASMSDASDADAATACFSRYSPTPAADANPPSSWPSEMASTIAGCASTPAVLWMKRVVTSVVATPLDASLLANCTMGFMCPWAGKGTMRTCAAMVISYCSLATMERWSSKSNVAGCNVTWGYMSDQRSPCRTCDGRQTRWMRFPVIRTSLL